MNFRMIFENKVIKRYRSYKIRQSIRKSGGRVSGNVQLNISGNLNLGNSLVFSGWGIDNSCLQIIVAPSAELTIGDYSGFSQTSVYCNHRIVIGKYVKVGAGSMIIDSDFHSLDWQKRMDPAMDMLSVVSKPVCIEDHVFIGSRSIISKGVTIGARSIIAAGSVVVSDIPSDCIAGGNPCKVIKFLNYKEE